MLGEVDTAVNLKLFVELSVSDVPIFGFLLFPIFSATVLSH